MKYFIITGTSRGLGEAMSELLIAPDHYLFCISRERNHRLLSKSGNIAYFEFDLNHVDEIESLMGSITQSIDSSNVEGIYLINNAAIISPVTFLSSASIQDITTNMNVNLLAPIILTSLFIRLTSDCNVERRILNISSASAKNLHPGMSLYWQQRQDWMSLRNVWD
ncbi:SDR family NAD(P)-dependent oxidoreductase [Paenibacillus mendelii]|uniref:SDR family NAD(P)-dependent oxidoreductase n=1 Tax=Paenibacillus mendelii TaxID=206163 RepID=A0ABV6J2G6_9BACL|nr:SDR family NAD(P)-dependent oxidoreductase [Paenibacillus mendelii]MCQ6563284.1 SDR family NAD(P)-dependent oxidoreductase [Paenibacillus mendelii]